ncbi:aminopeptidase P family protein [Phytoactinopolyspora alkaliphila]|uniref:Aminopeptidase P family protein n=1 Tax=Phytoactinopolyspora alkaliphila TaxID=1783498 RepID=A0A6N9YI02_9ACTN|nr:Xaa-Pro peptidase family protein [Phytoactinopolyspora alkaliphila]NED94550.1 aminopeptidase P family protein [Phytoactinopolyspora alkaliphila]
MTFSQRLSPDFYRGVHDRLRARLDADGLDAVVIDDWHDVAYVTGFFHHPNERPAIVWVARDRSVLLVPELEREHAVAQGAVVDEIVAFTEYPGVVSPFETLAAAVPRAGRWAHTPAMTTGRLRSLSAALPGVTWEISAVVDELRLVKQPEEIELHRGAARLGDVMLAAGIDLVKAAVESGELPSEAELADHVVRAGSRWMYAEHQDVVVVPMLTGGLVYSGEKSAYPHGLPSANRLKPGDTFILSLGGAVGGRYAESERTFFLGEPSAEQLRYFTADREAQEVGTQAIRPGAVCRDVNRVCLDVIRDAGFAGNLRHRQGHGIGLDFHEPPWLEDGDSSELQPGMVVSSEPGVYVPGHAGYRISDTVLVTETGHERLTTYPRDLDDVVIPL